MTENMIDEQTSELTPREDRESDPVLDEMLDIYDDSNHFLDGE